MRPAWVWADASGVSEAGVGEASVGTGVGTGLGVQGVGKVGMLGVTTNVGGVGYWALA